MEFLGKNLFFSKGRWRPSWISVIFGQPRNTSFRKTTGDLHRSIFYQVHWETTVDEISEYLLFSVIDGGYFYFCILSANFPELGMD